MMKQIEKDEKKNKEDEEHELRNEEEAMEFYIL